LTLVVAAGKIYPMQARSLLLSVLVATSLAAQTYDLDAAIKLREAAPAALKSITAQDLAAHLAELASDAYEGRLTGTAGQQKAAEYIARHFASCGLEPLGDEQPEGRAWTQHYPVTLRSVDASSGVRTLDDKPLNKRGAWALARVSVLNSFARDAKAVWLGASKKSDLEGKSLANTIPVISVAMDTSGDATMDVNAAMMRGMTREFGAVREKANVLHSAGARCGIVVTRTFNKAFLSCANMMAVYPGKPEVRLKTGGGMGMQMSFTAKIPLLIVAADDALAVLAALGLEDKALDAGAQFVECKNSLRFTLKTEDREANASNVVGFLRGSDPTLSEEALVFSAHMDHVGLAPDGQAFNGADDNGSGTSTLLELAQAAGQLAASERPKRSLIFLSVSGEELGLWGSSFYAENPTWPLKNLIANINIDMIGRSTDAVPADVISVTPTFSHKKYSTLARDAALLGGAFNLKLTNGDRFYSRSDHFNFARKGVPVVFFCDDEHIDYHMTTDDPEKIEVAKVERIAQLAFLLGLRTANAEGRPSTIGPHQNWFGDPKPSKIEPAKEGK